MDDNKVAVLLEDLRAQFRIFGEGLQLINEKVDNGLKEVKDEIGSLRTEVNNLKAEVLTLKSDDRQEHQQLMQMVKELDNEVQVEIKRVK